MTTKNTDRFYYKKSKINQLRGFCYTVQADCSARKAALKLGLEPATITLQIRSLEEDLGIKLFDRTKNNRFKITVEGQKFYEMAVTQLQGMENLFDNFREKLKDDNKNSLVIAGHYTSLSFILPKYLKILIDNKEFKKIKITLCNIEKSKAIERLKSKKIDFAFYPSLKNESIPSEIKRENIVKFKNVVFLNKVHPLAKKKKLGKKDLEKHEYLTIDKYTFYDPRLVINLKQSNIKLENGNSYITLGLVKENIAISGGSDLFFNENSFTDKNIEHRNVDHLLPKMFHSIFTLKNTKPKESTSFIIDKLREDSDL